MLGGLGGEVYKVDLPNFTQEFVSQINNNLILLQDRNIDVYKKLEAVYNESDKVAFLSPYFSCHAGCSFCCKYDVLITAFEANYIAKKNHYPIKNEKLSIKNNSFCPFLKDNICSIYKYRPLICRTYHVRGNPKECECDYNNAVSKRLEQYGTKIGGYGNKIYSEFAGFIDYVNISIFKGELKDIRNYF